MKSFVIIGLLVANFLVCFFLPKNIFTLVLLCVITILLCLGIVLEIVKLRHGKKRNSTRTI